MKDPTQQLSDHLRNGAYPAPRPCGAFSSWWKRGTQMRSPRYTLDFSKLRHLIPLMIVFAVPVLLAQTSERQAPSAPLFSTLTGPSSRPTQDIAASYLVSSSGLASEDLSSIYLAKEYKNV